MLYAFPPLAGEGGLEIVTRRAKRQRMDLASFWSEPIFRFTSIFTLKIGRFLSRQTVPPYCHFNHPETPDLADLRQLKHSPVALHKTCTLMGNPREGKQL